VPRQQTGTRPSSGRVPRPSTRVQRAEGEGEISEQENLVLGQIRNYFDLPFSRHFHKFDENELANRILWMIGDMDLPPHLNLFYYTDPEFLNPDVHGPIPRDDVDLFLVSVGNYILSLKQDDFDFQVAKRKADIERQRILYSKVQPRPKVRKLKRLRQRVGGLIGSRR